MPPRQQVDDEVAFRIIKSLETIQATMEKKNGNGGMKANIVGWIGVVFTVGSILFWASSVVTESKITQQVLIQRVEQLEKELKYSNSKMDELRLEIARAEGDRKNAKTAR